jgi:hypothetical protein
MPTTIPVVKIQEMSNEMLDFILQKTDFAKERYNSEQDVASYLRQEMDETYQPTWQVICGR